MTGSPLPPGPAPAPGRRGVAALLLEAVHVWTGHLWPLALAAAVAELPIALVSVIPNLPYGAVGPPGLLGNPTARQAAAEGASWLLLILYVPAVVALTALLEALVYSAVAEAYLGRRPGLGETWRAARGVLRPMLAKEILLFLAAAAIAVPVLLVALALGGATVGAAITEGVPAVAVVVAWLLFRAALSGPAIVGESLSGRDALRRSAVLTRGRFFGVAATIVVAGLPNLAVGLLAGGVGLLPGQGGMALETLAFAVLSPLLAPLPMCATVALYYEARRAEAGAWSIGMPAQDRPALHILRRPDGEEPEDGEAPDQPRR